MNKDAEELTLGKGFGGIFGTFMCSDLAFHVLGFRGRHYRI